MIEEFRQWFEARRAELAQEGISLEMPAATQDPNITSTHAILSSEGYEWMVQLWEDGMSDSQFLNWEKSDEGVEITHYEFSSREEMFETLHRILSRMLSGPGE